MLPLRRPTLAQHQRPPLPLQRHRRRPCCSSCCRRCRLLPGGCSRLATAAASTTAAAGVGGASAAVVINAAAAWLKDRPKLGQHPLKPPPAAVGQLRRHNDPVSACLVNPRRVCRRAAALLRRLLLLLRGCIRQLNEHIVLGQGAELVLGDGLGGYLNKHATAHRATLGILRGRQAGAGPGRWQAGQTSG